MAEEKSTRERILEAAITGIEKHGIDKLTTRKIAEEAEANIASINYYFRTKADLIAEVLAATADHMLEDVRATLDREDRPLKETVNEVFFYLIEGMMRYPGITTAHIYRAINQGKSASPGAVALDEVFERTLQRLHSEYPQRGHSKLRLALSQLFNAMMFSALAPDFFGLPPEYLPSDADGCRRLADWYTDLLLDAIDLPNSADRPTDLTHAQNPP